MAVHDFSAAVVEFFEMKPWEKLAVGGALVFGVEQEKEMAYCVLTGKENGCSLVMCRDVQALTGCSMLAEAKANQVDEMELIDLQLRRDYLECRLGKPDEAALNKWLKVFGIEEDHPEGMPYLRQYEPGCLARFIDKDRQPEMAAALKAAVALAETKELGAPETLRLQIEKNVIPCAKPVGDGFAWRMAEIDRNIQVGYPTIALQDELAVHRLRRLPLNGAELTCAIRMLPVPMNDEVDRMATVMLLLDGEEGVAAAPIIENYEQQYPELAEEYLGYVEECGRPRRIIAADPRAYCLLNELAGQMSTPIQRSSGSAAVNEAVRGMLEFMKSSIQLEKKEETQTKMPKAEGRGICLYCEKEFAASGMTKHIKTCGAEQREPGEAEYFMIHIADTDNPNFWLYADVKQDTSLKQLDQFLRDIWVECCGHMSAFTIGGEEYFSDATEGGRSMSARLNKLVKNGSKFSYEYDFGTPTSLKLRVVDEYTAKDRRKKVMLAARNIMPKYSCVRCGKRAEMVLRMGMEPIEESVFCEECAMQEEYAESMLPLLNSPRTGLCGYGSWFGSDEDDE